MNADSIKMNSDDAIEDVIRLTYQLKMEYNNAS